MNASSPTFFYGKRFCVLAAMIVASLLLFVGASRPAQAQSTITVNTIEDELNTDSDCSLREAITAADTNAPVDGRKAGSATGGDTITFAQGLSGIIKLISTLPAINDSAGLTIDGGSNRITISGQNTYQVFTVNSTATLTLKNLTVANGNASTNGGGVNNSGTLEVLRSTFSGNSATTNGGAIYNNNTGAAILRSTIVAESTLGGNCSGASPPVTDGGYNIDDGTTCGFQASNNSQPTANPQLDPGGLQNNGGPTDTIALQSNSPAIDAIPVGANSCGDPIKQDQRGVSRPQGTGCDIGAFELQQNTPPSPPPPPPPTVIVVDDTNTSDNGEVSDTSTTDDTGSTDDTGTTDTTSTDDSGTTGDTGSDTTASTDDTGTGDSGTNPDEQAPVSEPQGDVVDEFPFNEPLPETGGLPLALLLVGAALISGGIFVLRLVARR